MSQSGILNADMATLGRWLSTGVRWWLAILASLAPVQVLARGRDSHPSAYFDGQDLTRFQNGERRPDLALRPKQQLVVRLAPALCLQRNVELPLMSQSDLNNMLSIDSERYMPVGRDAIIVSGVVLAKSLEYSKMTAIVAGLPTDAALQLVEEFKAYDIKPSAILLTDEASGATLDFLPNIRKAGYIVDNKSRAAIWWALVAFAFFLNIGLLVWRDVASVDQISNLVDQQRPATRVAQRILNQIRNSNALLQNRLALRTHQNAIGALNTVTSVLPDAAWVQRYSWDGKSLRLIGYQDHGADIIGALRKAPLFSDVHSSNKEALADIPAGEPYDISAEIKVPVK